MKKAKLFFGASCISIAMCMTAFAGEWKQDSAGWWYQNDDGSYPTNQWQEINNKKYYFDESGYMRTDDLTISKVTYHFDETGACTNPFGHTIYNDDGSIDYTNWVPYDTGSLATFSDDLMNGKIVKINGQYYASPEYVNTMATATTHVHDVATAPLKDRYSTADLTRNMTFDYPQQNDLDGID